MTEWEMALMPTGKIRFRMVSHQGDTFESDLTEKEAAKMERALAILLAALPRMKSEMEK